MPSLIEAKIRAIVARQVGKTPAEVLLTHTLIGDYYLESLDAVELVLAVEAEFGVEVTDETAAQLFTHSATVGDLARQVEVWVQGQERQPRVRHFPPPDLLRSVLPAPFTQFLGLPAYGIASPALHESLGPGPHGFAQHRRSTDGMVCVFLPGDDVWIGSPDAAGPPEGPLRLVPLAGFLMDREPVCVGAFVRFLNATGVAPGRLATDWFGTVGPQDRRGVHVQATHGPGGWTAVSGTEELPVVMVSWFGANAYSLWANGFDWRRYTGTGEVAPFAADLPCALPAPPRPYSFLPSEAQWEYAARGAEPREYPWGSEGDPHALCQVDRPLLPDGSLPLAPVHLPLGLSPFGLHHMAGNVWNWCRDAYQHDASPPAARPSAAAEYRSERGGSWVGPARLARSSARRARRPHLRGRCLGFRCVGGA